MAEQYDFDLFVIGAGSGGVRASRIAGGHGARVAVAEERYLGGTCVNVGCIPKKLLVYASEFSETFGDAAGFGWTVGARSFDWPTLIANKNDEILRLNGIYERLLLQSGVRIFRSRAVIVDAHTIECAGARYSTKYILIATGGWPVVPRIPGAELAITSNEAFFLQRMPERVTIVGGGYIGVEFAGIFHGLGAQVTLVHRGEIFLRGFDDDLRAALAGEMRKRGVDLRFERLVARIEPSASPDADGAGVRVSLDDGTAHESSLIMFATGRAAHTLGLGCERVALKLDRRGGIVVDEYSRTSVENIYAIGDVTDRIALTPVAIAEGHAVADTLFGKRPRIASHANVPSAVFSQPPLATVGLTEAEARKKYGAVDIYKAVFRPLIHTLGGRDERSLMKLVVDRASDRVVGCHMVGMSAAEIMQGLAIAIQCGATKAQFDATIGIHPTAAEEFVTMREKASS